MVAVVNIAAHSSFFLFMVICKTVADTYFQLLLSQLLLFLFFVIAVEILRFLTIPKVETYEVHWKIKR